MQLIVFYLSHGLVRVGEIEFPLLGKTAQVSICLAPVV